MTISPMTTPSPGVAKRARGGKVSREHFYHDDLEGIII